MKVNRIFAYFTTSSSRSSSLAIRKYSIEESSKFKKKNLFEESLSKTKPSDIELKQAFTIKKLRENVKHLKRDNDSLRKTINESKLKDVTKHTFIQYDHWPTV